jgi:hypothetical protein
VIIPRFGDDGQRSASDDDMRATRVDVAGVDSAVASCKSPDRMAHGGPR